MNELVFKDLKVADFTWFVAGATTTRYLADFGATVVHVESIASVDMMRTAPPYKDNKPGINRSANFANYNSNKFGISLNLKHPRATGVAKKLIAWADVLADNFTPGTLESWGLGYEEIKKLNPEIIMLRSGLQGQTGPHSTHPSLGMQLSALAGFTNLTGWPDRMPAQPFGAYTDFVVPPFAVCALLAALDYKERTGKGQVIDLSQFEASLYFLAPLLLDYQATGNIAERRGNKSSEYCPHGVYPCIGKERWVAIVVSSDAEWSGLCRVWGRTDLEMDPRFNTFLHRMKNEAVLDELISTWTKQQEAENLMKVLQEAGVPSGLVENPKDLHEDPQLEYRQYLWQVQGPDIGTHYVNAPSFHLSETPAMTLRPAPALGEHNDYVCKELLGIPEEEYISLLLDGIFE